MCFAKVQLKFNQLSDVGFTAARVVEERKNIKQRWDDNQPIGFQRKFFRVSLPELTWRSGKEVMAKFEDFAQKHTTKVILQEEFNIFRFLQKLCKV